MNVNAEQVAEYLRIHPDFFETHITLLTDVDIPHPHGGRAISIGERQVLALREKNRLIETRLAELIQFGEENDAISDKIHRLACALMAAGTLDEALQTTDSHLREYFFVPHVLVRLWYPDLADSRSPDPGSPDASSSGADSANADSPGADLKAAPTSAEIRDFVAAMKTPYCGHHAVYETNRWFGEAAPHLKSFAMVRLGKDAPIGVLLLASEDAQRFYPEMGTLYLTRIGELVSAAVRAQVANAAWR